MVLLPGIFGDKYESCYCLGALACSERKLFRQFSSIIARRHMSTNTVALNLVLLAVGCSETKSYLKNFLHPVRSRNSSLAHYVR